MINYLYRPCTYVRLTLAQCKQGDDRDILIYSVICIQNSLHQTNRSMLKF